MPIITISRGCFHRGKEVAEKVAGKLGWDCISRDSLIEASDGFHDPAIKLARNIVDATCILDRFPYGKERYTQMIRASLLSAFSGDNLVYHGLAGHYFLGDISHQLKVRIIADISSRVAEEVKREGISAREAQNILERDDEERRKWSIYLHGIDTVRPDHYDLVINMGAIGVDDAASIIEETANLPRFQATDESLARVRAMALVARVKSELFQYPSAVVSIEQGKVVVEVKAPTEQEPEVVANIGDIVGGIEGVNGVETRIVPYF